MKVPVSVGCLIRCAAALACLAHAPAAQSSTGLTPLHQMLPADSYEGFAGGLYPNSSPTPPPAHLQKALQRAQQIVPRNINGNPDPDGVIVLLGMGFSNATQEFSVFERLADRDTTRNARVVILNSALRGQVPNIIKDPTADYWVNVKERLASMGLDPAQVQGVWLKIGDANAADDFPLHAQLLRDDAVEVVQILHHTFQELRLCYLSSRIYGGWSTTSPSPEPQAYDTGYSVKWLIEDQISGDPSLNHDPTSGPVVAPLLLWGPYLWADGTVARDDGLTWLQSDMESDGIHPGAGAEQKVADLLTSFFNTDPTATPWYRALSDLELHSVDADADATVSSATPGTPAGFAPSLVVSAGSTIRNSYIRFPALASSAPPAWSKLSLRTPRTIDLPSTRVWQTTAAGWQEATLTFANAPPIGSLIESLPGVSRDSTVSVDVRQEVSAAAGSPLGLVLTSPIEQPGMTMSRQTSHPPRLVTAFPACQTDLGFTGPGSLAISLCGTPLATGQVNELLLTGALPNTPVYVILALQANPTPIEGGQLVPVPIHTVKVRTANASGQIQLLVPGGMGPLTVYMQCVAVDPSQTFGYAFSNALEIEFLP